MSKQLYDEALTDVKKLKEIAEDNAKRALLEVVTPRIRDFIEQQLLNEISELDDEADEDVVAAPGTEPLKGNLLSDEVPAHPVPTLGDRDVSASAISLPDETGHVTLNLDALKVQDEEPVITVPGTVEPEYQLDATSIDVLSPLVASGHSRSGVEIDQFESKLVTLGMIIENFKLYNNENDTLTDIHEQIIKMIGHVENMYEYVHESIVDSSKKITYESALETYYKDLNKLQEQKMKKNSKRPITEEDVTLKLTGLPDDLDLDSVGVDLVTGEEEEAGEEVSGEEPHEEEFDFGGDEQDAGEEEEVQEEGEEDLDDDTVVEIDEAMLRREIKRMKALREETKPQSWGNGADHVDNFGGAKEEGEPLDVDVEAAHEIVEAEESDEDAEELDESDDQDQDDQLDEVEGCDDELDQIGNRRKHDEFGANVADGHESQTWDKRVESVQRRVRFEKRLQERAKARGIQLKNEATQAKAKGLSKKFASLKEEYAAVAKRFNESKARCEKFTKFLTESVKLQKGHSKNSDTKQPAEQTADKNLRTQLAETNLFNAKLLYTNKLLQSDSLSKKQKASIIDRIDEAKTEREVKLVYESLTKTLATTTRSLSENADRKVIGSSSQTTRPASTSLNEGFETDRWAQLAGINK